MSGGWTTRRRMQGNSASDENEGVNLEDNVVKCLMCDELCTENDDVICKGCNMHLHSGCCGVVASIESDDWFCTPECALTNQVNKAINQNASVSSSSSVD